MPKRLRLVHPPKTRVRLFRSRLRCPEPAAPGLLSLAGPEQGRLCCVSAAPSGTTQLFNESPDGFHCLDLVSLMGGIEEGQRRGLDINFPVPNHVCAAGQWLGKVLLFLSEEALTAETLIFVFFPTNRYFPPPCALPTHHLLKELTRLSLQSSAAPSPFFSLGFFPLSGCACGISLPCDAPSPPINSSCNHLILPLSHHQSPSPS